MIVIRDSHSRGRTSLDWLNSQHTFSFGDYYDQRHMGFRNLRVINEDFIEPSKGFPSHRHQDMEIITYVFKGAVEHQDSLGNRALIQEEEIQCMSAGTGIVHSECNHSGVDILHLLQIWILPNQFGLIPSYQQRSANFAKDYNRLNLLVSPSGEDGSLSIHQDIKLYAGHLEPSVEIEFAILSGRNAWLQMITGNLLLNGSALKIGDGAAISQESNLLIQAQEQQAEFLLFDLN